MLLLTLRGEDQHLIRAFYASGDDLISHNAYFIARYAINLHHSQPTCDIVVQTSSAVFGEQLDGIFFMRQSFKVAASPHIISNRAVNSCLWAHNAVSFFKW